MSDIDTFVASIVDAAPEFTADQLDQLRRLLQPSRGTTPAGGARVALDASSAGRLEGGRRG